MKLLSAWTLVHYASAHVYRTLCVPLTPVGFLLSPLVASTPHCTALRWMIHTGGLTMADCWSTMAVVSTSLLLS